jgi:hypothetical protein
LVQQKQPPDTLVEIHHSESLPLRARVHQVAEISRGMGESDGKNLTIPKNRIAEMKASANSVMPEGLLQALDAQQQKDLMTFLLTTPKTKGIEK